MSLRTDIQTRIITTLKAGDYPQVDYDKRTNLPSTLCRSYEPDVVCNEVEGQITKAGGSALGYVLKGWMFEALMKFPVEVDVTDSLMSFSLTYAYTDPKDTTKSYAVTIELDSQYTPEHPAQDGSHAGTRVKLSFVANVKK